MTLFYRSKKFSKFLVLAACLSALTACSATSGLVSGLSNFFLPKGSRLDWERFTLVASDGANNNTALAVDLVLVKDDAVLATLLTMPASKWFASRGDLVNTYPEGLRYLSLEMTPGQTLALPREQIGNERLVGAMVFADYLTPGEHRLRVDQLQGDVLLQLGARSFTVATPQPPPN